MGSGVIAFLPVYNEERRIGDLLARCRPLLAAGTVQEVLVVDDGSTDGTPAILRAHPEVTVIAHPARQGCGDAIRSAYRHALARGHEVFVIMAGNGKDDPAEIPRLLEPIARGTADYVQGSRFLPGAASIGLPRHRLLAIRLFTWTLSQFVGRRYTDCVNGFRAYRTAVLRDPRIGWAQDWLGHSYEIEFYLHYRASVLGHRIVEVPVSKTYPPSGRYTKVRMRDWLTNLKPLLLLRLGLRK